MSHTSLPIHSQLERDRTVQSMSLADEKAILKEIYKAERTKRSVQDCQTHDDRIKAKKARVAEMRNSLQIMRKDIESLRADVSLTRTAVQVGCSKESLLGMKLACPADKLGGIIGKKGSNVKQLMEKASVRVDIVESDIRLLGSLESLDAAAVDISNVIKAKEEEFDLKPAVATFLSGRKITQLQALQAKNPQVHIHLPRKQAKIVLRGAPEDIASLKQDLSELEVVEKTFHVSNPEAAYVIGKRGTTIDRLTQEHQVVIELSKSDDESKISVTGIDANVAQAVTEIVELVADAREGAETIPIDRTARLVLLKNHGAVMKQMFKDANNLARQAGGSLSLRIDGNSIVVRGTNKTLDAAKLAIQSEISRLEESVVRMAVDKTIIPKLIGKGGEVLRSLTVGTTVDVEFDKEQGCLAIIGSIEEEVDKVKSTIEEIVGQNQIRRIPLEAAVYKRQLGGLLRASGESIRALPCVIRGDDESCAIILRGEAEKIQAAGTIVEKYLRNNHEDDVAVSIEDLRILARGGKESKLVELEAEHDVKINSSWKDHVIYVRGEPEKVQKAVQAINTFLFGGDDWSVIKIPLDDRSVAAVIGKGGKNVKALSEQFKGLSIIARSDDSIVLRGPSALAEQCRVEIHKLVYTVQITQEVDITEAHSTKLKGSRFLQDIKRDVPVSITLGEGLASVRGVASDVEYVVALINEFLYGFYESRMVLSAAQFSKVKDAFDKPSIADGIRNASGAFVAVSGDEESLIFRGKRNQVKAAKKEALCLFDFFLKPNYASLPLPGPLVSDVGKGSSIAEISALSGACVIIDRDISSALVFSSDSSKLETAVDMLNEKIDAASKSFFEIELDAADAWIASRLIGRNGARVKALRKDTKCSVTIDTANGRVTVVRNDDGSLEEAKALIESAISEERGKCARVKIPFEDVNYFIGRKGQAIKEFRKTYAVEVEIVEADTVVLKGEVSAVAAAKLAVEDFVAARQATREQAKKENDEALSIHLRKDQVPGIIGAKGAVIKALIEEFQVVVDIDRNMSIVTVRRGDEAKRKACINKIRDILQAREDEKAPSDENVSEKAEKFKPRGRVQRDVDASKDAVKAPAQLKPEPMKAALFPPLANTPGRSVETSSTSETTPGRSWAHLAKKEHPEDDHPPLEEIEAPPEVIRMH